MKLELRAVRAATAEIQLISWSSVNRVNSLFSLSVILSTFFFYDTYLGARPYGICTSPSIVERSVLLSKLCTEEALRSWASGST